MRMWTIWSREIIKARHGQRTRDLSRSIGAKVEEDHGVAILDRGDRLARQPCERTCGLCAPSKNCGGGGAERVPITFDARIKDSSIRKRLMT